MVLAGLKRHCQLRVSAMLVVSFSRKAMQFPGFVAMTFLKQPALKNRIWSFAHSGNPVLIVLDSGGNRTTWPYHKENCSWSLWRAAFPFARLHLAWPTKPRKKRLLRERAIKLERGGRRKLGQGQSLAHVSHMCCRLIALTSHVKAPIC